MSFSWCCPFCNHNATIGNDNYSYNDFEFNDNNKYGNQYIKVETITCPNPKCKEYTLTLALYDCEVTIPGHFEPVSLPKKTWKLIPAAETKVFPDYIPTAIIADYNEACLIRDLSPKASSTLARRCLQGMIRDFWGIKKDRLIDEIKALEDKVDPTTWAAIDAIRKIGNIGAHMEKDINLIIDVEPSEAKLLIGLIETLINDWYIVRQKRQESMAEIITAAKIKQKNKNNNS
jgi:hypothetical protein